MEKIKKAFQGESITIVYVTSSNYLPILAVAIQSLLNQCTDSNRYDIVVLDTGVDRFDQENIIFLSSEKENVSIRFFEPISIVRKWVSSKVNVELYTPYYRALMPWIMSEYDKIIYLGADTIVKNDIFGLMRLPMPSQTLILGGIAERKGRDSNKGTFDMDVMVMNVDGIRKKLRQEDIMNQMLNHNWALDECQAMHKATKGYVRPLPDEWDIQPQEFVDEEDVENVREKAKIIHYRGVNKPWVNPMMLFMEDWWEVARSTVYYEEILRRMCAFEPDNRSGLRIVLDELFPKESKRRKLIKHMIIPFRRKE